MGQVFPDLEKFLGPHLGKAKGARIKGNSCPGKLSLVPKGPFRAPQKICGPEFPFGDQWAVYRLSRQTLAGARAFEPLGGPF